MSEYGDTTLELLREAESRGVTRLGVIMRHSARTFIRGLHDLENQLTDEGRELSRRFGLGLPKSYLLRGYASPAKRCVETSELILQGHRQGSGEVTRTRPVEALGVFYVLDQMKMYRAMQATGSRGDFVSRWTEERLDDDIVINAKTTAAILVRALAKKLSEKSEETLLDVFVSHDLTLHMLKACLLHERLEETGPVEFLEGILMYFDEDRLVLKSVTGGDLTMPNPLRNSI